MDQYTEKAAININETVMEEQTSAAARPGETRMVETPAHWSVPASLLTNSVGGGVLLLLSSALLLEFVPFQLTTLLLAAGLTIVAAVATLALAQWGRRDQISFWQLIRQPDQGGWLSRWIYILLSLVVVVMLWSAVEIAAAEGAITVNAMEDVRRPLQWITLLLALGGATFPAYFLAQQPACALWRNPLLPVHFVLHALLAGSSLFLLLSAVAPLANGMDTFAQTATWIVLFANLFVMLGGEFAMPRDSAAANQAAHRITSGYYRDFFWWGSVGLGHVAPMGLLLLDHALLAAQTPLYVWIGLFCFDYAYIMAPQLAPESTVERS